jgi:hypothetical protein
MMFLVLISLVSVQSAWGDDVYEPNNDWTSARAVSTNATLPGLILSDADWFKLELPLGRFEVNALFSNDGTKDLGLWIIDSNGVVQKQSFNGVVDDGVGESTVGRYLYFNVPATGTYYLKVDNQNAGPYNGMPYSLSLYHPVKWMARFDQYGPIQKSSITVVDVDGDGYDEIFVGTNKLLDSNGNEVAKGALLCLKHDGTLKWAAEFPGIADARKPGIVYATSSINSTPVIGDIDGDNKPDIVIGVGSEDSTVYGEKGGVYALDARTGFVKWFHQSIDYIGGNICGADGCPDGLPDGVFSSAVIRDLDNDGNNEVVYGGLDQRVWVLDGKTGLPKAGWPKHMLDTVWSSPAVTDLDGDGRLDILIGADITENPDAGTVTGGIFHVLDDTGNEDIPGFNTLIPGTNPAYNLYGKWEEQVIWSSPEVGDIDGDGVPEIVYGTGNYLADPKGHFIRVWNKNGTPKFNTGTTGYLPTLGKTFATPLFADLDGDGKKEIIATTLDGYLHVWNHQGTQLFAQKTIPFGAGAVTQPIFSSPVAVDIDGDNKLEIVYAQGAQLIVVGYVSGQLVQRTDPTKWSLVMGSYSGSPAVKDIDRDSELDFIVGGYDAVTPRAIVYRFRNDVARLTTGASSARYDRRQFREPIMPAAHRRGLSPGILMMLLD